MAKIKSFNKGERERYITHDEIDAEYFSFERDGRRLFQIDMYGRAKREIPGKTSQTIQLDKERAELLIAILKKEFKL